MNKKQKLWFFLKRIIRSKITVILAILMFWTIGSKMQEAEAGYSASVAYQYYLLGTKADTVQEDADEQKLALNLGSLGSGGVAGEFSYDDIVNSAGEENEEQAKQFASIMATYSTFNYFSNKPESFSSILSYVGRWLSAIILLPLAVIMDLLATIVPAIVGLIAKLNIVRFLADVLTNLQISSSLADALGIDKNTFKKFAEILLYFSVTIILFTLGKMFRIGGKVDQRSYSKLKGRLFSFVAVPIIIGIGATIIDDVMSLAMSSNSNTATFSRYLVDDRSWAYNFNFAPNGNNAKDGNITPDNTSSYVDLKFNPYTEEGKNRIAQINAESSLASNDDSKFNFSNSALALSFVSSESFSAVDYINYKGTKNSLSFYGRDDQGAGDTFGSYYNYARNNQKQIKDITKSYFASGGERSQKDAVNGGFKSAIDDYVSGEDLIVPASIAWRDRYIYGAKSAGANMDKYYAEPPSYEQMTNEVGTNNENAFSDQSMYLILSTMFSETGGKYYIDAPTRGILQTKASFDSNRSSYFVVSMVGNPFFTIFGLIAKPIIQLIALCAVLFAVLALGLLDMNLRPFVAWIKGCTLGDIEYSYALLVYSVGIAGTILSLIALPNLFTAMLEYIPTVIVLGLETQGVKMHTPQASLAYYGVGLVFQSAIALTVGFLFIKSKTFRNKLIELFTFCWAWARVTGRRLEQQASSAGRMISYEQNKIRNEKSLGSRIFRESFSGDSDSGKPKRFANKWQSMKDGIAEDLGWQLSTFPESDLPTTRSQGFDNYESSPTMDAQDIARNGMMERAVMNLQDVEDNVPSHVQTVSIESQEAIMKLQKNPTKENYEDAMDKLDLLENDMSIENVQDEKLQQVHLTREELFKIGQTYGFNGRNGEENTTTNVFNNQKEENRSDSDYRTYQTSEDKSFKKTEQKIRNVSNHHAEHLSNIYKTYETKEVQQLASALGDASSNRDIAKSLGKLNSAKSNTDIQKGLSKLQESISHLDIEDRNKINTDELSKSLNKVMDLNKNKN